MNLRIALRLSAFINAAIETTSLGAESHLQIVSNAEPLLAFGGKPRKISVVFHNPDTNTFEGTVRARVYQTSSATATLLGENPPKNLQVLAGQTVIESADLPVPHVEARTGLLVQWMDDSNRVVGCTQIAVYPTNLLAALKPLGARLQIGLFDPNNRIKPLLIAAGVDVDDLGDHELEAFPGKLAILGPFTATNYHTRGFTERVRKLAKKGTTVVWIQPPETGTGKLVPTFYFVPVGKGLVLVAQPELLSDIVNNPSSQLNLIRLAELAVQPEPPGLPEPTR
jgi:hypothetical protein